MQNKSIQKFFEEDLEKQAFEWKSEFLKECILELRKKSGWL